MGKRFTYDAIKARLKDRIVMNSDSATILDDGTFTNLLDVFCEGLSEIARYLEYRSLENKWQTAHDITSLQTMGNLIGRKRQRAKSAIGYVIVSHTDLEGVERLSNYGSTFFDLDENSDYDNIEKETNANYIKKSALVPWTNPNVYEVPKGTIFTASNGTQFISTKTVKTRILNNAWNIIKNNELKLQDFYKAGGWDGIKYLKIPVIQGVQREQVLGTIDGSRFQSFSFPAANVENASNLTSKDYFYVEVIPPNSTKPEKWVEVQKIRQAEPYDKVYEVKLSDNGQNIIIKFGDGFSGKLPVKDSQVVVHYLETKGSAGNIEQKFQINTMTFPTGTKMIDPRNNIESSFLSCTNITSIMGGKDIEDEDEFKTNAPLAYLSTSTTAVKAAYKEQVMQNSPVLLSKVVCYPSSSFNAKQVDITLDEDLNEEVANEVSVISNALFVSAIKANGDMVTDEESEDFIQTITKSIGDLKGPNDTLSYKEPNFIKLAPSIIINTTDRSISESEVSDSIKAAVASEYSIFNTDFKVPFYESKISYLSSLFNFTESVEVLTEAMANVDMGKDDIKVMRLNYVDNEKSSKQLDMLAIPFKFDKVYAANKYELGFNNCSTLSPYLLKVDLIFKNTTAGDSNNRTFFLYDNRENENVSLTHAIEMDLENNKFRKDSSAELVGSKNNLGVKVEFFDETIDNFEERAVRVAQFQYISEITNNTFMGKAKSFKSAPYENRPYEVDEDGKNKVCRVNDVDYADRISFDGTPLKSSDAIYCYKKNNDYYEYVDIIFNENYDEPNSVDYAHGYFIIPIKYLGFTSLLAEKEFGSSDYLTLLSELLNNYLTLNVYARPKQSSIEPEDSNAICFIDDDNIKVERVIKQKD